MTLALKSMRFTVDQYQKMAEIGILEPEERLELLKGYIIEMTPINSEHAGIVNFLTRELNRQLYKKAIICSQNPISLDEYNQPAPDIAIAHFREDDYRHAHPTAKDIWLVIEVADSSLEKDRQVKTELYAAAGIAEYWIVNIPAQQVECFSQPSDHLYGKKEIKVGGQMLSCQGLDFQLAVSQLF
ncbi:MAG: Uma2 family endonuclease [Bacteroidota bacterium]